MRYVAAFAVLVLLILGCADQKEGLIQPDQAMDPAPFCPAEPGRLGFPPKAATPDQGADAVEASLIPEDPEATYDPAIGRIKVYTYLEDFAAATGELAVVDFEDLPEPGSSCPDPAGYFDSIPNPLQIDGVTFCSPQGCLESRYCSDPTCPGGGMTLTIHLGSTITLPEGAGGIMMAVEGIGDGTFSFLATDRHGATISAASQGIPYATAYVGFLSAAGIAEISVIDLSHADLVLADVYFEAP